MVRRAFSKRGGFTLIELLCVIVIIAILAGLIMPTFSSVAEKNDGMKCVSNLRQIGAAVQIYVGKNDGQFPEIETDPSNPVYPPESNAKGLLETLRDCGLTEELVKCPADLKTFNYFAKRGTSFEWAPYADDELEAAPQIIGRRGQMTVSASKIVICFDTERVHGLRGNFKSKKNYLYGDGHIRNYWDTAPRGKPKN